MPTPIPLQEVPVGERNAIDTRTVSGLLAYRQMHAMQLLELPDYGGGDLDAPQRKEALSSAVSFRKPMAMLALPNLFRLRSETLLMLKSKHRAPVHLLNQGERL